jgi:hypothetical protein
MSETQKSSFTLTRKNRNPTRGGVKWESVTGPIGSLTADNKRLTLI